MFSKLQTRLTVAYAGMFGLVLALVAVGVFIGIARNAERTIRGELQASGAVFDRVWALKSHQLHDGADLLSRDFGFRAAVATNDSATVQSALDNLKTRQHVSRAFIVGMDGALTGATPASIGGGAEGLWRALDADPDAAGVLMIDGQPHEAVAAPIMAPALSGWVVFASRLDRDEVRALESLSSIPLHASILTRAAATGWRPAFERVSDRDRGAMNALIDRALHTHDRAPDRLQTAEGDAVALVKPLRSLGQGGSTVLLLRYPMAAGLAPYRPLLVILMLGGVLGLVLVLAGSWVLARGLTRPISLLQQAAQLMRRGEATRVAVPRSSDEIARLADSFNAMSDEIGRREERITHLALHDPETDLPNGVALEQGLRALVERGGEGVVVVISTGIDRFTHVRGAIGYRLASLLVAEIGARLRSIDRGMALGRLSSDMLGVAFRASSLQATLERSEAVLRVLEKPVRLGDASVDVTLTTGIAVWGEHGTDVPTLIERSSIALDQARAQRVKVAVFDAEAYGDPAGQLSLMSEMLDALASCEMTVHYQPKLDIRKGAIVGAEALVRWRHPVRGMMRPDLFVEMAEETGHIRALSNWVLDRAIADQAELRAEGHELSISVNISGRLMDDRPFADAALARIAAAGADICFEITETAVIERPEVALEIIAACSAAGVEISIDDYGSGLSSLAYLKQIQANELKIDKAFILSLAEGRRDVLLVKSTIDLAHSLGLKVTAEGVETPEALAILAGMGCDLAQGYLIARPMPLEAMVAMLDAADAPSPGLQASPERRRTA